MATYETLNPEVTVTKILSDEETDWVFAEIEFIHPMTGETCSGSFQLKCWGRLPAHRLAKAHRKAGGVPLAVAGGPTHRSRKKGMPNG
jgi:hypothetical protein